MSYIKYLCRSPGCKDLVWYVANTARLHHSNLGAAPKEKCKKCGQSMTAARLTVARPKNGRDLRAAAADRLAPGRERRHAAVAQVRGLRQQIEDQGNDSDDDAIPDAGSMPETSDDLNFLLSAQFNPNMRYTPGPARRSCRSPGSYSTNPVHLKVIQQRTIDEAQQRPDNTSTVMGAAIQGSGTLAAWVHAGATDYTVDRFSSAEWCHLWADCLGGPTTAGNLVAASFCANTEMLVIEHKIKGKRQFKITVMAECNAAHIAEMITYTVHSTKPGAKPDFSRRIDAKNNAFTQQDADDLRRDLDRWLATQK